MESIIMGHDSVDVFIAVDVGKEQNTRSRSTTRGSGCLTPLPKDEGNLRALIDGLRDKGDTAVRGRSVGYHRVPADCGRAG